LYTLTFDNESDTLILVAMTMTSNPNKKIPETNEYEQFANLLQRVISVPHSQIKAKLDAEKQQKKEKRPKTSDASHEDGDND
jgi:hypothetical protein